MEKLFKKVFEQKYFKGFHNIEHLKTILFEDLQTFYKFYENENLNDLKSEVDVKKDLIEIFTGIKDGKLFYILIKDPFEFFENESLINILEKK